MDAHQDPLWPATGAGAYEWYMGDIAPRRVRETRCGVCDHCVGRAEGSYFVRSDVGACPALHHDHLCAHCARKWSGVWYCPQCEIYDRIPQLQHELDEYWENGTQPGSDDEDWNHSPSIQSPAATEVGTSDDDSDDDDSDWSESVAVREHDEGFRGDENRHPNFVNSEDEADYWDDRVDRMMEEEVEAEADRESGKLDDRALMPIRPVGADSK